MRGIQSGLMVAWLGVIAGPALGAPVTLTYTGTVDAVVDFAGGEELPAVISIGTPVSGVIVYDPAVPGDPQIFVTSCSGGSAVCGLGSAVTYRYALGTALTHSVSIDGLAGESNGSIWLGKDGISRVDTVGFDNGDATGRFSTLSIAFSTAADGLDTVLPNEILTGAPLASIGIAYAGLVRGSGIFRTAAADGYYISFATGGPVTVPVPGALLLLATALAGTALRRVLGR